ncbi:DNA primase [Salinicola endophyticus]|uniref:DNA primase n=1 Tax=Salinicola endophyticus TaxID=1949083 RepID=A0ABY8FG84_9GAMM|nr:DNA primase [Salinicola endophyticus]WFF41810.1 DNA primase [Salinicola endophyticus]
MAGQISQRFIDDLLARTDIVDVVSERVQLKKSGRNHSGLCPFHQENSPSFTVSHDKQFYHCFGCGAHGNALRFLMEFDNLRFPEAVEQLAGRAGMQVEREGGEDPGAAKRQQKREEGVNLLELASRFFRERLALGQGKTARAYLERRGLSQEVIRDFGIGYAEDEWEALKRYLGAQGISEAVQVEYGLLVHREETGRTYDRFRDRVMFPIRDWKGRTIAFGGRVLGDAKPKYLNSPETPVFHKGRELYGLFEARQANRQLSRVLVVEGYMDVVALAQFGIRNACATLGTALTADHLQRLFRLVDEVVFCFDGDNAGRQAARRSLTTALPSMIDGRQVRFLFLPEGEDPDTLVRQEGREAFENRVTCASPLSEFLFEQAAEGHDLKQVEGRERFVTAVLEALKRLPEGVLKSLLLKELSSRSGIETSQFSDWFATHAPPAPRPTAPAGDDGFEAMMAISGEAESEPAPMAEYGDGAGYGEIRGGTHAPRRGLTAARGGTATLSLSWPARIVQLLLHEPGLAETLPESLDWCPEAQPDGRLCREVVKLLRAGRYRSPQVLLAHFHGTPEGERLDQLARREMAIPREVRASELANWVRHLERQSERLTPAQEYQQLLAKSRQPGALSAEEKQRLRELIGMLATGGGSA